jgi:PadR family transcriptional regulator PadR
MDTVAKKVTQLRKGILELAILSALERERHYGYSLIKALTGEGDLTITEGTIYPILRRLSQEGLVHAQWMESSQGPPRKYYSLTEAGRQLCADLKEEFRRLVSLVQEARDPAPVDGDERPILSVGREDHE